MAQYRITQIEDYGPLVGRERVERIREKARKFKDLRVANFNSTYYGGGVAEMISSLTLLMNSLGLRTEWRVIQGTADFFFDHQENAKRAPRRRDRSLQHKERNFRAGHLRKQRPQFSRARLCDCARPAAVAVDRALQKTLPVDLALPHRSLPAKRRDVEIFAALDRQLRRRHRQLRGVQARDEAAAARVHARNQSVQHQEPRVER